MDVSSIVAYLSGHDGTANLRDLKLHKTWCFMLNGVIDNKLSTSRKHIYDRKQVIQDFPAITKQVLSTIEVSTKSVFDSYDLPEQFSQFKDASELIGVVKEIPLTTPENHVQVIYLCLQMLIGYVNAHSANLTEDEGLLLRGLICILVRGLSKMSRLVGIECPEFNVEVIFHACDY